MIDKLQIAAETLQNRFIRIFKQDWKVREAIMELNIQVGHLLQAASQEKQQALNNEIVLFQVKEEGRNIHSIEDELCDCFLSLCFIYNNYPVETNIIHGDYFKLYGDSTFDKCMLLCQITPQLLDSYLILQQIKPAVNRNEKRHFSLLVNTIQKILMDIVELKGINIEEAFNKMCEDANCYLDKREML